MAISMIKQILIIYMIVRNQKFLMKNINSYIKNFKICLI